MPNTQPRLKYVKSIHEMLPWVPDIIYYINTQGAYFGKQGYGQRIHVLSMPSFFELSTSEPYIEGPYISVEQMLAISPTYNLFIVNDPYSASRILITRLRNKMPDFDIYFKEDFVSCLPFILEHTFIGHFKNQICTGVHYGTSDVIFENPVPKKSSKDIRYYFIKKRNPKTNELLSKVAPSTFWPTQWKMEKVIQEIAFAWCNKALGKLSDTYEGLTSNGEIKVIFCYRNNELKTVFPQQINLQG